MCDKAHYNDVMDRLAHVEENVQALKDASRLVASNSYDAKVSAERTCAVIDGLMKKIDETHDDGRANASEITTLKLAMAKLEGTKIGIIASFSFLFAGAGWLAHYLFGKGG